MMDTELVLFLSLVLFCINCIEIKTKTGGVAVLYLPAYSSHCGPYELIDPKNNTVLRVDGIGPFLSKFYANRANQDILPNGTIRLGLHRVTEADTGTYVLKYEPKGLYCPANYFSVSLTDAVPYWLAWSPWSPCTRTCGVNGVKHRNRVCSEKGRCSGDFEERDSCRLEPCQLSYWSSWAGWSSCSLTCGEGIKTRQRTCSTQTGCSGPHEDQSGCKDRECRQAAWSDWSRWVVCSQTCGGGTSYRTRQCRNGDVSDTCRGQSSETIECSTQQCPSLVERPRNQPTSVYIWTTWSVWSMCSRRCGREFRRRQRTCTDDTRRPVPPDYCGNGRGEESVTCNHPPCNGVGWGEKNRSAKADNQTTAKDIGDKSRSTKADNQTTAKDIGITVPLSGIVGTVAVLFIIILLVVVVILIVRLRKKNNAHRQSDRQSSSNSSPTGNDMRQKDKSSNRPKKSVSISEERSSHMYAEIDDDFYQNQKRNKSKSIVTLDNPYSDLPKSVTPTSKYPDAEDSAYYNNTGTEAQVFLFGPNTNSSEVLPGVPKSKPIKHGQSYENRYDGGYLTCTPTSSEEQLNRQPKRYVKPKR